MRLFSCHNKHAWSSCDHPYKKTLVESFNLCCVLSVDLWIYKLMVFFDQMDRVQLCTGQHVHINSHCSCDILWFFSVDYGWHDAQLQHTGEVVCHLLCSRDPVLNTCEFHLSICPFNKHINIYSITVLPYLCQLLICCWQSYAIHKGIPNTNLSKYDLKRVQHISYNIFF